jgi:hypothetical protein
VEKRGRETEVFNMTGRKIEETGEAKRSHAGSKVVVKDLHVLSFPKLAFPFVCW